MRFFINFRLTVQQEAFFGLRLHYRRHFQFLRVRVLFGLQEN